MNHLTLETSRSIEEVQISSKKNRYKQSKDKLNVSSMQNSPRPAPKYRPGTQVGELQYFGLRRATELETSGSKKLHMPKVQLSTMCKFEFKKDVLTENQKAHNMRNRDLQRIRNREKQDLERTLNKKYESTSGKFQIMLGLVPKELLSE